MHTVVELVPLLLHASLFLFFAGLVTFLLPINTVITTIVVAFLVLVATIYSGLTLLPVIYPDCPYWTPMSTSLWHIKRIILPLLAGRSLRTRDAEGAHIPDTTRPPATIVESMISCATTDSPARTERDARALSWTLKSLADDNELEPFLEGIPDLIHDSANHRRYAYDERIRLLINDPEVQLGSRMVNLIHMSDSGFLPPDVQTRRLTSFSRPSGPLRGWRRKTLPIHSHFTRSKSLTSTPISFAKTSRLHTIPLPHSPCCGGAVCALALVG